MSISNELSQELSLLESDMIRLHKEHEEASTTGDPHCIIPEINMVMERTYDRIQEIKKIYLEAAIKLGDMEEAKAFSYTKREIPENYTCKVCGTHGVRLYREYQTFLNHITLRCTKCALEDQKKTEPDQPSAHSIGWLVAAVPTEGNDTFWGFTSVPPDGVEWWNSLPIST